MNGTPGQVRVSLLPLLRYYESDSAARGLARFFRLQLCKSGTDGIKLTLSTLIYVILVMQNVFYVPP